MSTMNNAPIANPPGRGQGKGKGGRNFSAQKVRISHSDLINQSVVFATPPIVQNVLGLTPVITRDPSGTTVSGYINLKDVVLITANLVDKSEISSALSVNTVLRALVSKQTSSDVADLFGVCYEEARTKAPEGKVVLDNSTKNKFRDIYSYYMVVSKNARVLLQHIKHMENTPKDKWDDMRFPQDEISFSKWILSKEIKILQNLRSQLIEVFYENFIVREAVAEYTKLPKCLLSKLLGPCPFTPGDQSIYQWIWGKKLSPSMSVTVEEYTAMVTEKDSIIYVVRQWDEYFYNFVDMVVGKLRGEQIEADQMFNGGFIIPLVPTMEWRKITTLSFHERDINTVQTVRTSSYLRSTTTKGGSTSLNVHPLVGDPEILMLQKLPMFVALGYTYFTPCGLTMIKTEGLKSNDLYGTAPEHGDPVVGFLRFITSLKEEKPKDLSVMDPFVKARGFILIGQITSFFELLKVYAGKKDQKLYTLDIDVVKKAMSPTTADNMSKLKNETQWTGYQGGTEKVSELPAGATNESAVEFFNPGKAKVKGKGKGNLYSTNKSRRNKDELDHAYTTLLKQSGLAVHQKAIENILSCMSQVRRDHFVSYLWNLADRLASEKDEAARADFIDKNLDLIEEAESDYDESDEEEEDAPPVERPAAKQQAKAA